MAIEIERKFLVSGDFKDSAYANQRITQGYLCSVPERTVRVRIKGNKAYLTIKGKSNDKGISRYEWEKEIPILEAEELLKLCEPGIIDKVRYYISNQDLIFEVDEFLGDNAGLIMAEIELPTETTSFVKPIWLGQEVTGDIRYYNSYLSNCPFSKWSE